MIAQLLSGLISPVTNYFTKRSEQKTAITQQNISRVMNAEDSAAEWEKIQAESGKHSLKDEYWTVILSIPAIMAFHPKGAEWAMSGFAALSTMPDFYQYWLGVAILTSFGIRIVKR